MNRAKIDHKRMHGWNKETGKSKTKASFVIFCFSSAEFMRMAIGEEKRTLIRAAIALFIEKKRKNPNQTEQHKK